MSGLQVTFDELRKEVGFHLGYGETPDDWDSDQSAAVSRSIKGGLRRFMLSPLVPGSTSVWEWSFLRKSHLFSTVDGVSEYALPEDFGSPLNQMYFTEESYSPVPIVNESMLRARQSALPDSTGAPQLAAIYSRPGPTVVAQRLSLLVFPEPDGAYALRLLYQVNPEMLSESLTNPHGGAPHARTILFACLAESGSRVDGDKDFEQEYQISLAASIDFDRRLRGSNLGYNGDPSSDFRGLPRQSTTLVTFNSVLYDGED